MKAEGVQNANAADGGAGPATPPMRADIDGLRAIAVIIVLFYHAKMRDWTGGFVGVDVFFVISGYLIIPKIAEDLARNRFSLVDFFGRRIRRLVPALAPVLAFSFMAAVLLYDKGHLLEFGRSLFSAAAFVSNYHFLANSDYFARTGNEVLLLHTWSLGVEFQFYILAPIIFLLFYQRFRMIWVILTLAVVSLGYSVFLVETGRTTWAFFDVLPRFWELAVGGILGLARTRLPSSAVLGGLMRLAGLAAILLAATSYSSDTLFPGATALVPVLGAGLVLFAPLRRGDPILWLLSSKVMQWVGLRSYSIYLWHWPLFVVVGFMTRGGESDYYPALVASFVLAELSYRLFETPVRRRAWWRPVRRVAALSLTPVLVAALLWGAVRTPAMDAMRATLPLDDLHDLLEDARVEREDYLAIRTTGENDQGLISRGAQCSFDNEVSASDVLDCAAQQAFDKPVVLVVGDSHGRDTFHSLRLAYADYDFLMIYNSGCPPMEFRDCFPGLHQLLTDVRDVHDVRAIILSSRWKMRGNADATSILTYLSEQDIPSAVIGPGPTFNTTLPFLVFRESRGSDDGPELRLSQRNFDFDISRIDRELAERAAATGIPYLRKMGEFCDKSGCRAYVPGSDDTLMFWDNQHLTIGAIRWLATVFADNPLLKVTLDR